MSDYSTVGERSGLNSSATANLARFGYRIVIMRGSIGKSRT